MCISKLKLFEALSPAGKMVVIVFVIFTFKFCSSI